MGFTLVELMVALVLGLLVVLGASQLFLTSSQTFRSIEELNRRQEVVSYISNMLSQEVRQSRVVSPVGPGGAEVNESGRLKLEFYDSDEYNPYCSSVTDKMVGVEYFLDIETSSLIVEANCNNPSGPEARQEIIRGIAGIRFESDGAGVYVDVVITLLPSGVPPSSDIVAMRFTRHSSEAL